VIADATFAFLHFASLFVLVAALGAEAFVLRLPMSAPVIRLLARADAFYGVSAGALVAAGLCRVYFGLRGESYYLSNHAFWAKIATFIIIGLISIWPTIKFMQWRKALRADEAFTPPEAEVKRARLIVMIEVHLLALVALFAVLMARAIG
jgi:putative membrane protein